MTKVTRLSLDQGGGLGERRLHLREISSDAEAPLETVGQDLRTARQRKGEDLATISRALKIRKDHLEALEEGNIHALPGRPYAIGFLRSYAEYLGLDPAQCIERFKTEIAGREEDAGTVPQFAAAEEQRLPHGSLIFLVLLVIAVVYGGYYLSVSANRMLSEPVPPVPTRLSGDTAAPAKKQVAVPTPSPASANTADPSPAQATAANTAPAPSPPAMDAHTAAVPPAAQPANDAADADTEQQVAALPPGRVFGAHNNTRVELRVYRPTRLLVQGAGDVVFINRALRAGDIYRAPNLPGLTLTTSDGGAVEIVLDGSALGFVGKKGRTTEAMPLDPQFLFDRFGGHSG